MDTDCGNRLARLLLWVLAASCIAACQPREPVRDMLENYAHRVGNVLDRDPAEPVPGPAPATLPSRRERILATTDLRIGLFEFLDLAECDMMALVSERNSSLGRVMPPSRQLDYEVRMLRALRACDLQMANTPEADPGFSQLIREALNTKAAELPRVVWNAIFASSEFETLFSLSGAPLEPGRETGLSASAGELAWFDQLTRASLAGEATPGIDAMEAHYRAVHFNPAGGRLFLSMQVLVTWLDHVAAILDDTDVKRVCPQRVPTRRGRILKNVFMKFYAGEVQPYLSVIHREGRNWLESAEALLRSQAASPPEGFRAYATRMLDPTTPDGYWQRFETSIRDHTRAWQRVLGQCGLMPSRDGATGAAQEAVVSTAESH